MEDPSKLTDEELDKRLAETEEEDSPETPEVETPEETEESEAEVESTPVEEPEVEKPEPSRREQLRINDLLQKYHSPERKQEQNKGIDYSKELQADPDVIQQLEADRRAYGDQSYQQGLEQSKSVLFHTRLEIDAPKVESKYPQLDKDSAQFDPAVANSLNQEYLQYVGYNPSTDTVLNPNIRYADFVEARYEQANLLAKTQVASTQKNIAKQAASTGLRPDGSSAKKLNLNKAPHNMSDEELDAVISQTIPSK